MGCSPDPRSPVDPHLRVSVPAMGRGSIWLRAIAAIGFIVTIATVAAGCGAEADDFEPADSEPKACTESCIVAVGDSITQGIELPEQASYPAQLERITKVPVWNAGVSGNRAADVRARLPDVLDQQQPRVVVVLVGINDAGLFPPSTPLPDFTADLEAIIGAVRSVGATPVVCSLLPIEEDILMGAGLNQGNWKEYDAAVRAVASTTGVALVDLSAASAGKTGLLRDGLHPNAAGSALIAQAVASVLTAGELVEPVRRDVSRGSGP